MRNPYNFAEYNLIKEKNESHKLFNIVLVLFLIVISILICRFKFQTYQKYMLINNDNDYIMLVSLEEISDLEKNNKIVLNDKSYKYEIDSIDKEYSNINGTIVQTIHIKTNFKTKSNYIYGYILKDNDTLINMLFKFIRGG